MLKRPRRNRKSEAIRNMVRETTVTVDHLMCPLFIIEGEKKKVEVASMPGIFRYSQDTLLKEIDECMNLGVKSFVLFPSLNKAKKDEKASEALNEKGLYLSAVRSIKARFPECCLMSDVAMDPYSSSGHDGVFQNGEILNDPTLVILSEMALAQAHAGVDIIGPSDMMDGRVRAIRQRLDSAGLSHVSIMSYTAKYASGFYGPFREALDSAPRAGDKKSYQMDPANRREALLEARLDTEEGADILMVKPALSYLDVIRDLSRTSHLPIAAYNVSGEYAMVQAAAQNGWIDGEKVRDEILLSIRRAGAQIILTYFAKAFARSVK